jgi:ribosomal protein L37AE/L43A
VGEIVQFRCACGYESEELYLGSGGIEGPEGVAAHCQHCRAIVAVVTGERLRCPKCRRKLDVLEIPRTGQSLDAAAPPKYGCPRCANATLQGTAHGVWD